MSRPINSIGKTQISTTTAATKIPTVLDLDVLNVKNIYLIDSLITKNTASLSSADKLMIQKGSIVNKITSTDPTQKTLTFNNVNFQPDSNLSNIVSIFTDNILKVGRIDKPLELLATDLNITANNFNIPGNVILYNVDITNSFIYRNNIMTIGNASIQGSNITIQFKGLFNTGNIYFNSTNKTFNIDQKLNILDDTYIDGNLTVSQINTSFSNISNNLTVNGNINGLNGLNITGVSFFENKMNTQQLYVNDIATFTSDVGIVGSINIGSALTVANTNIYFNSQQNPGILTYSPSISKFIFSQSAYFNRSLEILLGLTVSGSTILSGTTINGVLSANRPVTISNTLVVTKNASFNSNLSVDGTSTFNFLNTNSLNLGSINNLTDVALNFVNNQDTGIINFAYDTNSFNINNDVYFNNSANISGNLSTSNYLFVFMDANINGNVLTNSLYLSNNLINTINGNLLYNSNIVLTSNNGNLNISNILVSKDGNINGELLVGGNIIINKDAQIVGNLLVQNCNVDNNIIVGNIANIKGNIIGNSNLIILKNSNIQGNLNIDGNLIVRNKSNLLSDVFINGNTYINKNVDIVGFSNIKSNVLINKSLSVLNGISVSSLLVGSNLSYAGNIITFGDTNQPYGGANIIMNFNSLFNSGTFGFNIVENSFLYLNKLSCYNGLLVSNDINCDSNIYCNTLFSNSIVVGNLSVIGTTNTNDIISNGNLNLFGWGKMNELQINTNLYVDGTTNANNIHGNGNLNILGFANIGNNINCIGNITCNTLFQTSGIDKKMNIREIEIEDLKNLNKIKSYNYDLIMNGSNNYGFLAHEILENYPMLENNSTVNYIGFIPLLLEKIKILEKRLEKLENKI